MDNPIPYKIIDPWDWINHFECAISKYTGAPFAVACDSNSNAIKLVLEYLKVKNETIFIPKNTYVSVPAQIIHSGNTPYFIDLEWEGEYQLYPLPIWDSATRFRKDMYISNTYQILSFHLKKILNIGTGGMILTHDSDFVKWARPMIYDGRHRMSWYAADEFECIGYHMYMTPEQAERGLEIFNSDRIADINDDCGSSKTYKDLTKQKIFEPYINVPKQYKGVNFVIDENGPKTTIPYIKTHHFDKICYKPINELTIDDIDNYINIIVGVEDNYTLNDWLRCCEFRLTEFAIHLIKEFDTCFLGLFDFREGNYNLSETFISTFVEFAKEHDIDPKRKILVWNNNLQIENDTNAFNVFPITEYVTLPMFKELIRQIDSGELPDAALSTVSVDDLNVDTIRKFKFLSYNRRG